MKINGEYGRVAWNFVNISSKDMNFSQKFVFEKNTWYGDMVFLLGVRPSCRTVVQDG